MVIVKIKGGLGNQLFQYAAGKAMALDLNTDLYLDTSRFEIPDGNTPRDYFLDRYCIVAKQASRSLLKRYSPESMPPLCRIANKLRRLVNKDWGYQKSPGLFRFGEHRYMDGYWQGESFFKHHADRIRQELSLRHELTGKNEEVLKSIRSCESVSLHVRRGDYVKIPEYTKKYGTCSPQYYSQAVSYCLRHFSSPRFFIFSDDIPWCRDKLELPDNSIFIDHNDDSVCFFDLALMSSCRHNIIANSTFSWWGAWLNSNSEKLVIAPSRWDNTGTTGIVPDGWMRM